MPKRNSIAEIISEIVKTSKHNNRAIEYQNYRNHLKSKGLLREDSYNWPIRNAPHKEYLELFGRHSKNAIINNS